MGDAWLAQWTEWSELSVLIFSTQSCQDEVDLPGAQRRGGDQAGQAEDARAANGRDQVLHPRVLRRRRRLRRHLVLLGHEAQEGELRQLLQELRRGEGLREDEEGRNLQDADLLRRAEGGAAGGGQDACRGVTPSRPTDSRYSRRKDFLVFEISVLIN